jgi:hypothetical protein
MTDQVRTADGDHRRIGAEDSDQTVSGQQESHEHGGDPPPIRRLALKPRRAR